MRVDCVRQGNLDASAWEGSQTGGEKLLGRGLPPARAGDPPRSAARRERARAMAVSVRKTETDSDDDRGELRVAW